MPKIVKTEEGSILGIAMIYFVIFSITGMGMLAFAAYFRLDTQDQSHSYTNKYAIESAVNVALWRANSGSDSLANYEDNGVTATYIDSTRILTVSTNKWNQSYQLTAEFKPIHPFGRSLSYTGQMDTSRGTINYLFDHRPFKFAFLPTIDTAYYRQNAVQIHTGTSSYNSALPPGIHYIDGGLVRMRSGSSLDGSLVVVNGGQLEFPGNSNAIIRSIQDTNGVWIPAIIFDSTATFTSFKRRITVDGPVFSERDLRILGTFTGPIVAPDVTNWTWGTIDDQSNEQYYTWPPGFGDLYSYDWPKKLKPGTWSL